MSGAICSDWCVFRGHNYSCCSKAALSKRELGFVISTDLGYVDNTFLAWWPFVGLKVIWTWTFWIRLALSSGFLLWNYHGCIPRWAPLLWILLIQYHWGTFPECIDIVKSLSTVLTRILGTWLPPKFHIERLIAINALLSDSGNFPGLWITNLLILLFICIAINVIAWVRPILNRRWCSASLQDCRASSVHLPFLNLIEFGVFFMRQLLFLLDLGRRCVISPRGQVVPWPNTTIDRLAVAHHANGPSLLDDLLLMVVAGDVELAVVIFFIHVQFMTSNQRFESHVHFKLVVVILLLLKECWIRLVLFDHHRRIKNKPVRCGYLHRWWQYAWGPGIPEIEILAVKRVCR